MRSPRSRWLATCVVTISALLLAACGAGPGSSGPATVEVWDWDAETGQRLADAFNASHDDVKVTFVLQPSNTATQANFRNVMTSGQGVPCLVRGFGPLTTAVVNGWAQDITDPLQSQLSRYSPNSLPAAQVGGRYYGLPTAPAAQFMIVNKPVYDRLGVAVPTTWAQVITAGRQLHRSGVDVMNLAGEDPSTLINLAQQAGARWFRVDGDTWRVNLLGPESMKAADVIQQLVDGDLVANQTYQDRPALYSYFDSGKLASLPTQWWSLTGLQTNFSASLGKWAAVPMPQFDGAAPASPGIAQPAFVPVGCANPAAAIEYNTWVNTTPEGVEAGRNPTTGAVNFPVSTPDPSPYATQIVPTKLFGEDPAAVGKVILGAQRTAIGQFEQGPDYDAWFPEMQDQWGQVVARKITMREALTRVQDFIAKDLTQKGIAYSVG